MESFIYELESLPKVICLTETHLDDDDDTSNFRLPGYSNIEVKNRNKYGGGVMIQVHESATIKKTLQTPFEAAICVEINSQSYTFKTLVVYSKPRTNKNQFIELLDEYLQGNTSATMPFIICGDFNIDTKSQNLISSNYVDIINANGFSLFDSSDRPTRETDHSSTCLDHFLYQNIPSFKSNILLHQNIADHHPILASWLVNDLDQTDAQCKFRNTKFIHDESRRQLFLHELQEHLSLRENEILSSRDPSLAFEIFNSSFIKVFDKFAPMQNEKEIKSNNKPKWLTNSLKNLKTKRNKAHKKGKITPINKIIWRISKFSVKISKTHTKNQKNLTMQISLSLALVIQSKLIIYLKKSVAEVRTQKIFLFYPLMKRTSYPLSVTWQKSSINILSMYLIKFVSRSITCLLFPFQTMTSLYIYTRSQRLKLRSSLIAWLTKHHLVMMA